MLDPVGARRASWSRVRASPPAATIRSRAEVENLRAATVSLGISGSRSSSRTVPTMTTVLELSGLDPRVSLTIREREIGGRLIYNVNGVSRRTVESGGFGSLWT